MGDTRITQKYLRRWPASKRARSWAGRMVKIETENGVWRVDGHGYTFADRTDAWVLPFEEAQRQVEHCGPEKRAAFLDASRSNYQPTGTITERLIDLGNLAFETGILHDTEVCAEAATLITSLREALDGVLAEADRDTRAFRRAREALREQS